MVDKGYVPERGDVVWIDFAPQSGHEQAGRRPGLVVSPKGYNKKVGLALFVSHYIPRSRAIRLKLIFQIETALRE